MKSSVSSEDARKLYDQHLAGAKQEEEIRARHILVESEEQAHLVIALHQVAERLGGLTRAWRFDRMATVASPGTGKVTATFAAVAKHYAVTVEVCPPRATAERNVDSVPNVNARIRNSGSRNIGSGVRVSTTRNATAPAPSRTGLMERSSAMPVPSGPGISSS